MTFVPSPKSKMPKSRIPIAVKSHKSSNVSKSEINLPKKTVLKAPVARSHQSGSLKKQSSSQLVKSDKKIKNAKSKESEELSAKMNEKDNICKKDKPPSLNDNVILNTHERKDFSSFKKSVNSCNAKEKGLPLLKTSMKSVDPKEKFTSLKTTKNFSRSRIDNISLKNNVQSTNSNTNKESFVNATVESGNSLKELSTPKVVLGKENKALSKPSWFFDQKDIKFEANDALKKLILREREPSPSSCAPGFRFSSILSRRSSIYQTFEIPPNPFKEAMRAIENASAKRDPNAVKQFRNASPFKVVTASFDTPCADSRQQVIESLKTLKLKRQQNSIIKVDRPSFYTPSVDPQKDVMESLKKLKLERQQKSSFNVDRPSFNTPCFDPKKEVMESLKKLKLKQQQKSSKKVTFSLNIEECMAKDTCDSEPKSFQASDGKLTQIIEKSQENTPNSPQSQKTVVSISKQDQDYSSRSEFKKQEDFIKDKEVETIKEFDSAVKDKCANFYGSAAFYTPVSKSASVIAVVKSEKLSSVQDKELEIKNCKRTIPIKDIDIAVKDNFVNFYESTPLSKSVSSMPIVKSEKMSSVQHSELYIQNCKGVAFPLTLYPNFSHDNARIINTMSSSIKTSTNDWMFESHDRNSKTSQATVYTPRPISTSSKSKLIDSCSPEFFVKGTPETLLRSAPICTPLVLKGLAKSAMLSPDTSLSPVRLKLDFSEKDAPMKETFTSVKPFDCKNIVTAQKKLDELADQECCMWLSRENGPVLCGRYMENPVAKILREGDETNFIPIKF